MTRNPVSRRGRIPAILLAALLPVLLGGVPTAAPAAPAAADAPAPAWDADIPPVTLVTNGWVDVREILRHVAENTGLGLQMAPDVSGQVNVHLEKVAAGKALDALTDPVGLGYEVVDGVLIVYRDMMVSRWLTFDYPVTERQGRGELEVSPSSEGLTGGSSGGSSGGGDGENQNSSNVTSSTVMSVWPHVVEALAASIFPGDYVERSRGSGADTPALNAFDADGRMLVVHPMAGLVQVTAESARVERAAELLERLKESLLRQVAIEVRIMEVYLNADTQTGINWSTLLDGEFQANLQSLDTAANIGQEFLQLKVDSKHVSGVMQAISTNGELHTVSTPRVTTLNNQKAIVRVVREDVYYLSEVEPVIVTNGVATEPVINYTPVSVPVGVVLDVTPQVGRDRMITLNVHPTISDVVGTAVSPNEDTAPILSVRELDTVGKVRDGETLIIAGLISSRENRVRSGVPVLKDLPLLGYLFGSTSVRKQNIELVVLLTPRIMEGAAADAVARTTREELEGRM
ncbi:hypothetical protein KDM41_07300 [bacterium]|nr:hypothetical protein [bacterium]